MAILDAPLFLKFQRDLARLVTKARGLKEKKARTKTRGKSPLPRPKMQPKLKEAKARTQEVDPKAKDAPSSQPSQKEDPPAKA